MNRNEHEMRRRFIGILPEADTKDLREAIRAKHGKPVAPLRAVVLAQEAPEDWRTDKTALGKVTNA